jgi:pimeloyl-ACP methyl ester carboxylesterase
MSRFVLVHGAWLGAWCWDAVAAALRAKRHDVVAVELPGHGRDETPIAAISLAAYVDRVTNAVATGNGQTVLVGHSMAGIVLSSVAEAIPERLASLIYVAAYLLPSGQSIVQASAAATDSLVGPNMVPAPDWSTISIKPEALKEVFAADAPQAEIARLKTLTRPEPAGPFNTPVAVSPERFGRMRRAYIKTARDRAVTPKLQEIMLAGSPCASVVTMETSHSPFFAQPEALAGHLMALARG